jgi:hypothetical protein
MSRRIVQAPRIATVQLRFRKESSPAANGHLKRGRVYYLFFIHLVEYRETEANNGMIRLSCQPKRN